MNQLGTRVLQVEPFGDAVCGDQNRDGRSFKCGENLGALRKAHFSKDCENLGLRGKGFP